MAEKLKPDIVLKAYWNRNAEFADLFNALLYDGNPVIQEMELEERDTESSIVLQTESNSKTEQTTRDLFKVVMTAENTQYVLLGIENQQNIHYAMALRDLEYCTYSYIKQYEKIKERYPRKKGLCGNEFLSHMRKTDKLIPVITVVIYYGDEEWDGAKSLYGMMDIPEEVKPFVNDYKMNLIEVRNTNLVFHNKNNRDLFHLFHVMCDKEKSSKDRKREVIEYAEKNQVDSSVLRTIASVNGVSIETLEKKEDDVMLSMFKELKDEAEKEGEFNGRIKEIITFSKELNMSEEAIIEKIQERMKVDAVKSREYYNLFNK